MKWYESLLFTVERGRFSEADRRTPSFIFLAFKTVAGVLIMAERDDNCMANC